MNSNHSQVLTTTANALSGYTVVRELGVVRGIIVRSRSIVGNIGASLQTLFGGNITIYTELCEQARADAFELMLAHAREQGGNAVIAAALRCHGDRAGSDGSFVLWHCGGRRAEPELGESGHEWRFFMLPKRLNAGANRSVAAPDLLDFVRPFRSPFVLGPPGKGKDQHAQHRQSDERRSGFCPSASTGEFPPHRPFPGGAMVGLFVA